MNWRRDISGFRLFLTSTVTLCIQEGENVEEIIYVFYTHELLNLNFVTF